MMLGRTIPLYIRFCWRFMAPILTTMLLVTSLVAYVPPTYGDYKYPWYAATVGWMFACSSLIPVVVVGMSVVWKSPGDNLYQKFLSSIKPTDDWQPSCKRDLYQSEVQFLDQKSHQKNDINGSSSQVLLVNIGCQKEAE